MAAKVTHSSRFQVIVLALGIAFICRADDPRLVVDPGGHTGMIRGLAFTKDSQYLVSAGDDKIVRVWSVAQGKTVRTIRGEIGDGPVGGINAIAISPDDRYVAVGGWLPKSLKDVNSSTIRIHDFQTGNVVAVLEGLGNVVESLAFSPDGQYLASGTADNMARIWEMKQFRLVRQITGHTGRVHCVTFSPDSSILATGSFDGTVRLWSVSSGKQLQQMTGHTGFVISVVFTSNGSQLVSIGNDSTLRFWDVRSGQAKDLITAVGSNPANMSVSGDGGKILMSGVQQGQVAGTVLSPQPARIISRFTRHVRPITATALSFSGEVAATAGEDRDEIYVWGTRTGNVSRELVGLGEPVRAVGFAKDGRSIAIGNSSFSKSSQNHYGPLEKIIWLARNPDADRMELGTEAVDENAYVTAVDHWQDYSLSIAPGQGGDSKLRVLKAGQVVNEFTRDQTSGYRHLAFTFTPKGQIVSGGVGGILSIYDLKGRGDDQKNSFVGHTGRVIALAVSPDGRTLISGSDDQTVRLWDLPSRRALMTIFVGKDNEWVAWTREGYYASSLGGDRRCGWYVNQGQKAALYYPSARFQKEFYRPDVVSALLEKRSTELAVKAANEVRGKPEQPMLSPADVTSILPPLVYVIDPDKDHAVVEQEDFHLRAVALSNTIPITSVTVLLNGAPISKIPAKGLRQEIETDLKLRRGPNSIKIVATNGKSSAESDARTINCTCAGAKQQNRPNLILLAIGISKYSVKELALDYADRDAQELEKVFLKQRNGLLFNEVTTRVITNEQATRGEILRALDWFSKEGTSNDLRVLFLAGHGELNGLKNQYYFCSNQHTPGDPPEVNDVRWDTLLDSLTRVPGKAVLMVDTCHSGAVSGSTVKKRGVVNLTSVLKEFTDYPGVVVFAASTGTESSLEKPEWQHGAFTKAILEGLGGEAPAQDRMIKTLDLANWVIKRVPALTGGSQHSIMWTQPPDLLPFPLFSLGH
jgi:WD40 repeat protein